VGLGVAKKIIAEHLVSGLMKPGEEIGIRIDQTLTQDATGTLVMLELEAMGIDRVRTEVSVQYVDHNLIQIDHKNADDHLFLRSACRRLGVWYSPPGNGVSHPVHQERFGRPGATLLGADSHTPAAGAIGMLAIGAGGTEVALAMAGEPFHLAMPEIWGVRLFGRLPRWVSAKDVILEMLRRHGVQGGIGRIIEYHGPGLEQLSAMDRHVIANMGAELGATTTVFPSDEVVLRFLDAQGRAESFQELLADPDPEYDVEEEIDLSQIEPLIALPSSPGKVVPVREVEGREIYQAYVGSSANPGYRDFAVAAMMLEGRRVDDRVSFDVNPTSRQILENLTEEGHINTLLRAGARIHQAGCNGCIGMGQAPATGRISLRTVPRNFPGRSGTREDSVYLVSPETATASAMRGVITDPRTLEIPYPEVQELERPILDTAMLIPPLPPDGARSIELVKGPNIASLPSFEPPPDELEVPILLKVGDDVSTDEILPAGARVLPFRSNIPKISEFAFDIIDPTYPERAREVRDRGGHAVVGGRNYGQGSSREHAALAPRYLGLRVVIAKGFARIHCQNLVNFGVLPLVFVSERDYEELEQGDVIRIPDLRRSIERGRELTAHDSRSGREIRLCHRFSERQVELFLAGGLIEWMKGRIHRNAAEVRSAASSMGFG
jgi:aconitate hydratase